MQIKSIYTILALCMIFTSCFNLNVFGVNISERITESKIDEVLSMANLSIIKKEELDITYPLSSNPALVEKGNEFQIEFKTQDFQDIYVYISTAYEPVVDFILLEIQNTDFLNGYYKTTVLVPPTTPEELYNLTIVILKDDNFYSCSKQRSVNVYSEIKDDFTFIHITDLHVGDPRGLVESIHETIDYRSVKKCIEEINLLHPDFVIISGDLVFGQLYPFEYRIEYKKCYEFLQSFDVPTFLSPGNHDGYRRFREDGLEIWQEYFGPLYYSFDFGDYHFISINSFDMHAFYRLSVLFFVLSWGGSISSEQLDWIENDLKSTDSALTFMFMHHNPLWETNKDSFINKKYENRENLLDLIKQYNVDMVLAGHVHTDNVTIQDDTIFLTTTTPQSEIRIKDGYWGYRFIEVEEDKIKSYNYKEPKYSMPSYRLNHSIWKSDGIAYANIENDLEINIDAMIRFTMLKGNYSVKDGEILMKRDNEKTSEIYVSVNVNPLDEKTVVVYPWIK